MQIIEMPDEEQLIKAKKFPWQWAVILLLSAVVSLFGIIIYNDRERITHLNTALSRKDSINFDWQNKYLGLTNELMYKNNIIDRQQTVIEHTDSVARKRLEKPAKQIVKTNE
jgi:cell division protein FtsL